MEAGDDRSAAEHGLDDDARYSDFVEGGLEIPRGHYLIAGRVDGREPDQILEVGDEPIVGPIPQFTVEPSGRQRD